MSSMDLLGWSAMALFVVFMAALAWLIVRPNRRLQKVIGDGARLGLRLLDKGDPELSILEQKLAALPAAAGRKTKIGCAYVISSGKAYLASVTEIQKRGGKTTYSPAEKYFHFGPTGVDRPFSVLPKPPEGRLGGFVMGLIQRFGMEVCSDPAGQLPEFRERFMICGPGTGAGPVALAPGVQRAFVRAAETPGGFDPGKGLAGANGVLFAPDSFVIQAGEQWRLKNAEKVRSLIDFGRAIEKGIRLG